MVARKLIKEMDEMYMKYDEEFEYDAFKKLDISGLTSSEDEDPVFSMDRPFNISQVMSGCAANWE